MAVYLISLLFVVPISVIIRNKRLAIILFGIMFWALASFRDLNLGLRDTTGTYFELFQYAYSHQLGELLAGGSFGLETAFFLLATKIIQSVIGNNYQIYIAVLSLFQTACFTHAVATVSDDRRWDCMQTVMACIAFFSIVYFYSYTMLRQFTALSILLAFAYPCLQSRNKIRFLIAVMIAGLVHSTSLVFLIVYPLCMLFKYERKHLAATVAVAVMGTVMQDIILAALKMVPIPMLQTRLGYIAHGIYASDTGDVGYGTLAFLIMLALLYIWGQRSHLDPFRSTLLWIVSAGIAFQGWSHVVVEFYRVAIYFTVFNSLMLPEWLGTLDRPGKRLLAFTLISLLLLSYGLFALSDNTGVVPYRFCWDVGAWHQ